MDKLIEEVRVGDFTDRSDYNSLVEELDISSDAQADIISELEDVGLIFRKKQWCQGSDNEDYYI